MNNSSLTSKEPLTVFEVEVTGGLGGPQPHGVDDVVPVAGNGGVVGQGQHHLDEGRARRGTYSWKSLLSFFYDPFLHFLCFMIE